MKRWQLTPPTPFSITSPLKHIGLPKPPHPLFFSFRSKGYTQQRKACVERKKHPVHTFGYFYTVKTTDRSAAPKVCAHLLKMCVCLCRGVCACVCVQPCPDEIVVSYVVWA